MGSRKTPSKRLTRWPWFSLGNLRANLTQTVSNIVTKWLDNLWDNTRTFQVTLYFLLWITWHSSNWNGVNSGKCKYFVLTIKHSNSHFMKNFTWSKQRLLNIMDLCILSSITRMKTAFPLCHIMLECIWPVWSAIFLSLSHKQHDSEKTTYGKYHVRCTLLFRIYRKIVYIKEELTGIVQYTYTLIFVK